MFEPSVLRLRNDPSTVSASPPARDARHASLRARTVTRGPHAPLPIDLPLTAQPGPCPPLHLPRSNAVYPPTRSN